MTQSNNRHLEEMRKLSQIERL